jgi:hypothetical protein
MSSVDELLLSVSQPVIEAEATTAANIQRFQSIFIEVPIGCVQSRRT